MSKLSIEERVDLLLKEGVDKPEKWLGVRKYEVNDFNPDWAAEWLSLSFHHHNETEMLFNILRELVKRLKNERD